MFSIVASLSAIAVGLVVRVDNRSVPALEPFFYVVLGGLLMVVFWWLIGIMRPLRWTQTFKPNAEPSFILALAHGIALTLPAFFLAVIIEHKITGLSLADALIERSVLESDIAARLSASSLFLATLNKPLTKDEIQILEDPENK